MDEDATLLSVLRVALGDNESLNYIHASHFNSRDLTKQEKTGAMSFLKFHIIVENDQAELEPKNKKLETADSSSLHIRTWPTVQLNFGNDVLLGVRQPVPEFPALYKVEVGISNLRVKIFQQKKKPTARP